MLHFAVKPHISFQKFINACEGIIPEGDIAILKRISLMAESPHKEEQPTLKRWYQFETALRNELVKIRASRKHIEPGLFLRGDGYSEPSIAHIAMNAYRNPSILGSEEMLDRKRWRVLDELSIGHYFDVDFLIIYALKLLILERWEKIRTVDKARTLQYLLETKAG